MPDTVDVLEFRKLIKTVQDPAADPRTVAIMAASYVDLYLAMVLRTKMPGLNSVLKEKMFEGFGPLTSLAAKIDLARALGLITKAAQSNLIILNRVRNRFAHDIHVDSFEHADVVKLCDELDEAAINMETRLTLPGTKLAETHRQRFAVVATILGAHLHNILVSGGVALAHFTPFDPEVGI